MTEKIIDNITTSDNSFAPSLINSYTLADVKFAGNCLINHNISFIKVINLYISYTLDLWSGNINTDLRLNADPDKYVYSGYVIGFDARSQFSLRDGSIAKMSLFLQIIMVLVSMLIIKRS